MSFRKTPTFAVLQTALRSDFSSLPLFKGLHYYECGKFTFPARGRAPRQIGGLFRKVRFSETQVIILIIMRKSKNDTFCFFTQFGNALPYGKRVNLRPYILCVPLKGRKEGENAVSRKARGGVALKLTENRRRQLAEVFVNQKDLRRVPKSPFWISALDLPHACGYCGKIECGDCIV